MDIAQLVQELQGGGWRVTGGEMFTPVQEYDFGNVVECSREYGGLYVVYEQRGDRVVRTLLTHELQITATGSPEAHIALVELNRYRARTGVVARRTRTVFMHHVSLMLEHPERARAQPEAFTALIGEPLNSQMLERIAAGLLRENAGAPLVGFEMTGDAVTLHFQSGPPITIAISFADGRPMLALGGYEDKNLLSILARRA